LLRHRPLPWRGFVSRRRNCVFASQFFVSQPPSEHGASGLNKAIRITTFALISTETLVRRGSGTDEMARR
jgi:hypothetical protein